MLNRKLNQLVHEFLVFAVQVEVVENGADSTHRPQLFRKRIAGVGRLFGQLNRIRKFQRFVSVDLAGNLERSLAGESVSTGNDKLFSGEDVKSAVWIKPVDQRHALLFRLGIVGGRKGQLNVGHDGRLQFVKQTADAVFDVLVFPDEFALTGAVADEFVHQSAVEVVSNAKGEHAGFAVVGFFRVESDLSVVRFSNRWAAVGQEENVIRVVGRRLFELFNRHRHGGVDVRSAAGVDAFDEHQRLVPRLFGSDLHGIFVQSDVGVVNENVKRIPVAQVLDDVFQSVFRLSDFLAHHGSGGVQSKDDVFRARLFVFCLDFRAA